MGCGHFIPDSTLSVKNLVPLTAFWRTLDIHLNGTNVGEYGRLIASGDVNLSGGNLFPSAGFHPQAGQVYTIVEKTSPGLIANEFLGPEGTVTTVNGMPLRISYVGGDGNDVTLTVEATNTVNVQPTVSIIRPTNGAILAAPFGGTIQEGGACEKSEECLDTENPAVCLKIRPAGVTETPKTGVCKLAPRGRAGDPCFTTCVPGSLCGFGYSTENPNPVLTLCYEEDGLFCSSSGTEHRCARLPSTGDPCSSSDGCGSKLYCSQSSVCVARSSAGVACAAFGECAAGLSCVNGSCAAPSVANKKTCGGDYN